jgi:hypothetical protein
MWQFRMLPTQRLAVQRERRVKDDSRVIQLPAIAKLQTEVI